MTLWLPGYRQVPILGCTGPGTMDDAYPSRWVAHTTESPAGSMPGIIALFTQQPCYCPHFAVDPLSGERVQFIPLDWSAAALRGGRSGVETNRAWAIQTELIGYAEHSPDRSPDELAVIAQHLADIAAGLAQLGRPLDLATVAATVGSAGYGEGGAVRMTPNAWRTFPGVCGHANVPFQDHWDPGRLDLTTVAHLAQLITNNPTPEDDTVTPEQMATIGKWMQEQRAITDKKVDALAAKVDGIALQLDPTGVAAGTQAKPSPPFLRQLVERIANKTGAV